MQANQNKHELLAMIEMTGNKPLTPDGIRNLATLGAAYDALCHVRPDEHSEAHAERSPNAGRAEQIKPAVHP